MTVKAQIERSVGLGLLAGEFARMRALGVGGTARPQDRTGLVERLWKLHGLPQKIGQILSLSELGEDQRNFDELTESSAAIPANEAFAVIRERLGSELGEVFKHIDGEGISASLGQVHRAWLRDGRAVAVKFLYPGIEDSLDLDLKALGWLTAPVGGLKRGFDLEAYKTEVGTMLRRELDYTREAATIRRFGALARTTDFVRLPDVVDELSGPKILTMTWVGGESFAAARNWGAEDRARLSASLLKLLLVSCLRWGVIHGDPHTGNYRFSIEGGRPVIGLLDFGCVKDIESPAADALAEFIQDAINGENATGSTPAGVLLERFVRMGFSRDLLEPMASRLPALCDVLFMPFAHRSPFDPSQWRLGERVTEALGEDRWNFRFAGPANLIFFMRALQGVIQYLSALGTCVDWREIASEVLQGRRPATANAVEPRPSASEEEPEIIKSKHLRLVVTERGREKVSLTFKARVARLLPDMITEDLQARLDAQSIDVHKITDRIVAGGFEPGVAFELVDSEKSVRVWLE